MTAVNFYAHPAKISCKRCMLMKYLQCKFTIIIYLHIQKVVVLENVKTFPAGRSLKKAVPLSACLMVTISWTRGRIKLPEPIYQVIFSCQKPEIQVQVRGLVGWVVVTSSSAPVNISTSPWLSMKKTTRGFLITFSYLS